MWIIIFFPWESVAFTFSEASSFCSRVFPNERLVGLLACVFVWLSMLLGTPVFVTEKDVDFKSWGVFTAQSDSSLLFTANTPKTRGHIYSENAVCNAPSIARICLLNKLPMATIIRYETLEKTHEDPVHRLWRLFPIPERPWLNKTGAGWKIFLCQSLHRIQNMKTIPVQDLATLLFSMHSSVSTMLFLNWAISAMVHSPCRCSEHLGLSAPFQAANTPAASSRALKWSWQDSHLAIFPRNMTFACCGLRDSVGANRMWRETFTLAWWLLQGLLEQSSCWGLLNSWWQQMSAREDGRSIGKCSPETWVSMLGKMQGAALYLERGVRYYQ